MSTADSLRRWSSIASLATLGTNRATGSVDVLGTGDEIAVPSGAPEQTLLRVAAANYLWRIAGTRSAPEPVSSSECAPRVSEKLTSEAAAWRLCRMLNGQHAGLIPEWLALATRAGSVLPAQWLPVALDSLKPSHRDAASAVLGAKGAWLVQRNPAWAAYQKKTAAPSEEHWLNGTFEERRAALAACRATDPPAARTWLESTWKVDPPEAREAWMRTMLVGLSHDDEPFLECALDDKRKAVRCAAAECLARLPRSAYIRRNLQRLQPLFNLEPPRSGLLGKLRKRRLEIQVPAELDKAAVRDGLELKPPVHREMGERAWWLTQMLSMMPPAHWTQHFSCDTQTLIDAAVETEYATNILFALSEAAIRHRDQVWIQALCDDYVTRHGSGEAPDNIAGQLVQLIQAAPVPAREPLLSKVIAALGASHFDLILGLLSSLEIEWSADTTRLAFERLRERVRSDSRQWVYPVNTLSDWGRQADPVVAAEEMASLQDRLANDSPWRNALETLREIIDFRADMRQELLT